MLWLCQITFAGVGALDHRAARDRARLAGPARARRRAGSIAAAIGVVIGVLTIRLGNLYVALVTLDLRAAHGAARVHPGGLRASSAPGVAVAPPRLRRHRPARSSTSALAVFAVFAILIVNLRRSTTGLALNAVRWSENASRTMGLSVIQMKMLVSGLAAFVAGVGGGLYALAHKQAIPLDYATLLGLVWLAVLVTFGVRSNIAALLAGCVFVALPRVHPDRAAARAARGSHVPACSSVSVRSRSRRTPRARCTSGRWASSGCSTGSSGGARGARRDRRSPAATIRGWHAGRTPPTREPDEQTAEVARS